MNDELEQRLCKGASSEACVAELARYFDAHELAYGHGTDNARDEAYWLVRHLQGWRDELWERPPDPRLAAAAAALARRRVQERKPLAYLLGEAWFAGLPFYVDERVLVPRSPLAEIIERRFAPWCKLAPGDHVLDIGTGSGCLAIATAYHCGDVRVDATDVSKDALEVAARNAARHDVAGRVRLVEANLFPRTGGPYRVIISNPPYVPDGQMRGLPPEYAHEPILALAGGRTGLEPAETILREAARHLARNGILVLEVGGGHEELMRVHPRLPATWVDLEHGGEGVLVLTAEELETYFQDARRI